MLKKFLNKNTIEAGCDEAGRGCLAGPVFAAAVILPPDYHHSLLNDSKKLSEKARDIIRPDIEKNAISYGVAMVGNEKIDRINILNASILAMHRAVEKLKPAPSFLLIDGNRFKAYGNIPYSCIIKGDSKFASIAAASVLAKTYRDEFMQKISKDFPEYKWKKNKGYPTAEHRHAILKYGISKFHRKSFRLIDKQKKLNW